MTVLSDGLMAALEPAELRAVLTHENAHLSQRHHLLLWAFAAWRQALPWLPTTRLAQEAVNSLIEMLADDVALRTDSKATLIKAIAIVASGSADGTTGPACGQAAPGTGAVGWGRRGYGRLRLRPHHRVPGQPPAVAAAAAARRCPRLVLAGCVLLLALAHGPAGGARPAGLTGVERTASTGRPRLDGGRCSCRASTRFRRRCVPGPGWPHRR